MKHPAATPAASYQVRFKTLETEAFGDFAFRCDARGNVELDALGHKARMNYLLARALVGRNFARPAVVRVAHA
jgi:hypothetical protein